MLNRSTLAWRPSGAWYGHTGSRRVVWAYQGEHLPNQEKPGRWLARIDNRVSLTFLYQRGRETRLTRAVVLTDVPMRGTILHIEDTTPPHLYRGAYEVIEVHPSILLWKGRVYPLAIVERIGDINYGEEVYRTIRYRRYR